MLDLFYQGSPKDQIRILKEEIRKYATEKNIILSKNFSIALGDLSNVGNGALIIDYPNFDTPFKSKYDKRLLDILKRFNIDNIFLTYNYLFPQARYTQKDIKEFSVWIKKLSDIIIPRLIILLGENSHFCFFKRKFLLRNYHGKLIGDYNSAKIMTSYAMRYYEERSEFEDKTYKEYICNSDWKEIQKVYMEEIK